MFLSRDVFACGAARSSNLPLIACVLAALAWGAAPAAGQEPEIAGFTPVKGEVGTLVKIAGNYFTDVTAVEFGGVRASFRIAKSTMLKATVPEGAETGPIRLIVESGPIETTRSFEVIKPAPGPLVLSPPAPNPSRGPVNIRFLVPKAGHVSLEVFDVRGQKVQRLADGWLGAGSRELVWPARDKSGQKVRPGLYFVRLKMAELARVRTIVVLQ